MRAHTFFIIYLSVLLRMRNIADKFVKKTKTHVLSSRTWRRNKPVAATHIHY
jgi:hypothetical protein